MRLKCVLKVQKYLQNTPSLKVSNVKVPLSLPVVVVVPLTVEFVHPRLICRLFHG